MSDFKSYINLFLGGPEGGLSRVIQGYAPQDRIGIVWRGPIAENIRDADDSFGSPPIKYGATANEFIYRRVKSITAHGGQTIVTVYEFEEAKARP